MEEMIRRKKLPLHVSQLDKLSSTINITHIILHSFSLSILLYHRLSILLLHFTSSHLDLLSTSTTPPPLLPFLLLFFAELLLSIIWLFEQAYRVRPVKRSVFIDRLPEESKLLPVDVVICTADPEKEPTVEVMNTVVSAMALDYPAEKLHVYLSDDGGSKSTLWAMKEAWVFATWWVPFCRKYGVKCRCPMAYFEDLQAEGNTKMQNSSEFNSDRMLTQERYERFKERLEMNLQKQIGDSSKESKTNHPPIIQVIDDNCIDPSLINQDQPNIPKLVYVAREKRPSHPHHFKAGALNVLLRVSALVSNSPVVLVLDCDMYSNDPTSAKQAMCFYLDPNTSPSLAFVQFPQRFRNVSKSDIYDCSLRNLFNVLWKGLDGLNLGPVLCGTGFFINRKALYYSCLKGLDLVESRSIFGYSNYFIKTLGDDMKMEHGVSTRDNSEEYQREAEYLASCTYENDTEWGKGVGFFYHSLVEDFFTGYNLHCRGWKSVYLYPERDPFLGSAPTCLNDYLIQTSRWYAGLMEVGLSKFCPLIYGPSRRGLSILQRFCYAWLALFPLTCLSGWCFVVIPQLCLFNGIPLYPKVSSATFPVLAFFFTSTLLKHSHEVLTTGGNVVSWRNEWRMWIVKMITCYSYGSLDAIMKNLDLKKASFIPTNKVTDDEQARRYHQDVYDFQTSDMFMVPIGTAVILNLVCLFGGLARLMVVGNWDEMAPQVIISALCLLLSKPFIEGMVVRKDKAKFPRSAIVKSAIICTLILAMGPLILFH